MNTTAPALPLLLTVPQAAEALQMSPYTVRQMLRTGDLTGVKHGNHWRVPTAALNTWITNNTYTP